MRIFLTLLLQCLAWGALADSGVEVEQKKKAAKPAINLVKQKDGSVFERLDLSKLPGMRGETGIPGSPAEWLARMMDPTRNGLVVRHPQLFAEWLDAVTEPSFMTALATVAMDPGTYPKALGQLADPATASNLAENIDPEVVMRWMLVGMDLNFYQAVFQRMLDPQKYLRWAAYSINNNAATLTNAVGSPVASWSQLSERESRPNPWLVNRGAYRY